MEYTLYITDVETTGLDSRIHDIIEMSLLRLSDNIQKTWRLKPLNPDASEEDKQKREAELIAKLDFINEIFHNDIMQNLGIAKESDVFTGKTFHTEEAIRMGLVHEQNTMQYALEYAHQQGLIAKINSYSLKINRK